jgi:hypothetical protein
MTKFQGKGDWFLETEQESGVFMYAGPFETKNATHIWRLERIGTGHIHPNHPYNVRRISGLVEYAKHCHEVAVQKAVAAGVPEKELDSVVLLYSKTKAEDGTDRSQVPSAECPEGLPSPLSADRASEADGHEKRQKVFKLDDFRPKTPEKTGILRNTQLWIDTFICITIGAILLGLWYGLNQ